MEAGRCIYYYILYRSSLQKPEATDKVRVHSSFTDDVFLQHKLCIPDQQTITLLRESRHRFLKAFPSLFDHTPNKLDMMLFHRASYPLSMSINPSPDKDVLSNSVQYRQLVSRGATQRLHSPSLDHPLQTSNDAWEFNERQIARGKARRHIQTLGVPWSMYSNPLHI
jgi:hypothetical protein